MLKGLKQFNLPEVEEKVLKFWKENRIFEKTTKLREGAEPFRFFEGPPTANGRPGIHHILSRAFKDVVLRYKTMRGYLVKRKAGWDTHGLPVEIEVEKELGFKSKQDIERFGIAEFNEKAKVSVWKYKDEWEKLTERIGLWLDLKNPYITYKTEYIESLWWVFQKISKRGLLKKSFKVVHYCPRCQTPLSSHEMGQPGVYKTVKDPSIFVKFELALKRKSRNIKEYLLIWTTTPWTLPANVAVAVNPKLVYTKYKIDNEYLWSYNPPPIEHNDKRHIEVVEKVSGKKLMGLNYKPLFRIDGPWLSNRKFFKVYGADFIKTDEGTGLVHIAPAFGEDDLNLIKKHERDLVGKIPITIDDQGIVQKNAPGAGKFAKEADRDIVSFLEKNGLLFKAGLVEHEYPFCWRCGKAILYFARYSWFIEMSKLQKELIQNNQKINWVPEHIKEGRFGEWLREVKDWAISRNRYWGTPLPIWECEKEGHLEVVGSLEDLDKTRFSQNRFFLLRHGEAEHNVKNIIASGQEQGAQISKLTSKGFQQAERAAKNLIRKLKGQKLDFIFVSPYLRTRQTAEIVAGLTKAKIVVDERLSELNTGIFNWRPVKEYKALFGGFLEKFNKAPSGGENLNDVKKRMFRALLDINASYENKNILIVSHGDPLWVLEGAMRGLSNEEILKLSYPDTDGAVQEAILHNWPYNLDGEADLHRPYIDFIYLRCRKCGGRMTRVKEVADVWFDSGAMPFAQEHYPFQCGKKSLRLNLENLRKCVDFPADYITEGLDQTRGWFYTLLAVSTALGLKIPPYLNVITLGLVLDKRGQKMSKSKGNAVDPWETMRKYGADAVRWYFYTVNPAGEPKRFDEADLAKMLRKFIMIIYNSFVFWNIYAIKTSFQAVDSCLSESVLDSWILARLNQSIAITTANLEKYDIGEAGKAVEIFVDDLSRWYIRRSRERLQNLDGGEDSINASRTLYYCLLELSKLIAPFTPFFAESLYKSLAGINNEARESVHLEDWPRADEDKVDYTLLEKMEETRRLASLVLALRAEKGIKVRQPLRLLEIKSRKLDREDKELLDILKDEVNVKEVGWNFELENEVALDTVITSELKEEGLLRELTRMVQGLRHDANYVPKDRIILMLEGSGIIGHIINRNVEFLKKEVGAKSIELKKSDKFDTELESKLDDQPIWIGVRKI